MKKSFLLLLSLFGLFASNISIKQTNNVNAESISVTDKEYNASYHLSQMNASKKLLENYDGNGVKVAVIDSGINIKHEEFFKNGEIVISDESAYVSKNSIYTLERDYQNNRTTWLNALNDTTGHGTHVASLIAAQANGRGIIGIASNVELVVIKMATNSADLYEYNTITTAIKYAYQIGADVINMSIAGYDANDYYTNVINSYDNTYNIQPIIVAAAGNDNVSSTYYPAGASNIISIAASSKEDYNKPASFTNYGHIDFAAPGYTYGAYMGGSTEYKDWQGTSFASPLVAGLAALYKEQNPNVTRAIFIQALKDTSTTIEETSKFGWSGNGLINADKLLHISHATSLTLSAPNYPSTILDPLTFEPIEQVLDISDVGWKFDLNINPYPSNTLLPSTHYTYTSNPDVIRIIGNKLEVVGPGTTTIRVESIEDPSVFGEISLTVENQNELESNPIFISGGNDNNILNLKAGIDDFLDVSYASNKYDTWKNAYGIWAHDDNDRFVIEDDYYITDIYNGGGYKIYYQAIDYTSYDNLTGTYPYVIDYKIVNVINGIDINVESISLNKSNVKLMVGEEHSLNVSTFPEDVTNNKLMWRSSDESVVNVSKNGLLTALKTGTSIITVTSVDGNKTAECVVNVVSENVEEPLVEDIYDALDDFSMTRDDPTDLSGLRALVEDLKTRYENIENKDAIINSDYISHMEKALDFLENEWYGVVRVRVTNKSSVKSLENEEWTLCDAIQNKSVAMRVIEIYDSLDAEVQDILDEMYDITGTDGSIITIGKSLRYIKASLSVQSSEINDDNILQTLKQNSMIIYITIGISSLLFVVSCIIAVLLYKNKQKNLEE